MAALTARRAKNQTQAGTPASVQSQQPAVQSKAAPQVPRPSATGKLPLKEVSKNLQTPARSDAKARESAQRPTTGKLPSRRKEMLARTPTSRPANVEKGDAKHKNAEEHASAELNGDQPTVEPTRSTYDVPTSPDAAQGGGNVTGKSESRKPLVRGRKAEGQASNNSTHTKKHKDAKRASPQPTGRATKSTAPESKPVRQQPSRRTKAKPGADANGDTANHVLSSPRKAGGHVVAVSANKQKPHLSERRGNPPESIEDFEQVVVNYGGEEPSKVAPQPSARQLPRGQRSEPTISQNPRKNDSSAAAKRKSIQHPDGVQSGASQQDAIVLSDRVQSSSPSSALSSTAPPVVRPGRMTAHQVERKPATPALLSSSPPIARKAPPQIAQSAPLDEVATRKATVISFDKSGPRNQGTLSSKKTAANLTGSNPGSHPLLDIPVARKASSVRTRLDFQRPPRNQHATGSNVADNTKDALSAFLKKPGNGNRSLQKATSEDDDASLNEQHNPSDDGFDFVDDPDEPTLVDTEPLEKAVHAKALNKTPTTSQRAMPPPSLKVAEGRHIAPRVVSTMTETTGDTTTVDTYGTRSSTLRSKRALDIELNKPLPKRAKVDAHSSLQSISQESRLDSSAVGADDTVLDTVQSSQHIEMPEKASKTLSRFPSQGTVDMHGSPIPKNLVVPEKATALEVFSQQAGLSYTQSSGEEEDEAEIGPSHQAGVDSTNTRPPPASRKPGALSSNSKPRPASPLETSQAISELIVGQHAHDRVLLGAQPQHAGTDPFTSSESAPKEPAKQGGSSILANALRAMASEAVASKSNEYTEDTVIDDPDKTLVEPEPKPREAKRMVSMITDDSSETSEDSEAETSAMRDVGAWRSALQPHQMNLFDELVHISHRLVAHLVDQETAARHVVEDYRRRGERIVEVMEQSHAQEYQLSVDVLDERKKRMRKEMRKTSKELEACKTAVAKAEEEREERKNGYGRGVQRLERLLAEHL